ncbi:PEP-CTERM sorting domain-containing protein [Stieleria sp. ICT_E10.1]|uniref:PEP-CTERM sorting domain-containing protein n=1 Tax=Stieleria sedimenti TaxID=2976331 RepID=UPI000BAE6775|nr:MULTISPECIES: PEP-CTERM sorting domain-containing protein [Pirellulaceae]MCS7467608.1 PEP-CTERM sorting domain-containing protein [Stieleria sedimenti]PAY19580.1 hypothetical protein CKO51_10355 [Rhodopirellula sp. SM50]
MRGFVSLCALALAVGIASEASAAAVLRYSSDGTAGSARDNLVVLADAGDTVRLSVFVFQDPGDTRIAATGLTTAGFQANFNAGVGVVSNATTDAGFSFGPPATFDNVAGTVVSGGGVNFFSPLRPGKDTGNALIGFFDYTVQQSGSTTTFTFTDPNPGSTADNVLDDASFTNLDPELFANAGTITITSVPEPTAMLALSGVGCMVLLRRRRR